MADIFDAAKHPRGHGGRFGLVGRETVGERHLKTSGVLAEDIIDVLNPRMRKYKGFKTVEDFVAAHPKGRAHALRLLAADQKAGDIAFIAAGAEVTPKVAARNKVLTAKADTGPSKVAQDLQLHRSNVGGNVRVLLHGEVTDDDSIVALGGTRKYKPGGTVGDFVANHPKGASYARKVLAADYKAGRVQLEGVRTLVKTPKATVSKVSTSSLPATSLQPIVDTAKTSAGFQADIAKGWDTIPDGAKRLLAGKGVKVHAPERLVDVLLPHLANQQPRGWPPGSTWKEVVGAFAHPDTLVVAEKRFRPAAKIWEPEAGGGRTVSVMLHEGGHAVDRALNYHSLSRDFTAAYVADVAAYKAAGNSLTDSRYAYFLQPGAAGRSEMFAEQFADMLGHPTNSRHPPLKDLFPNCAAHMKALIGSL